MGYPMTYQRVLNRNRLQDGDCGDPPGSWTFRILDEETRGRLAMLAGDLRRLEQDAVDEKAVCAYIAQRIGVDPDAVAAVLKEFISW